jgi:WXG100 family type VII secretion target
MSRIKIAPDQIRQVSSQLKQFSQEHQATSSQLSAAVNGLQGVWEEPEKDLLVQQFEQWKLAMTQFTQLVDGAAQQLDATASRFESIDAGG